MSESTKRGVRLTIVGVLLFMTVVVASFIHRIGEPRIMSVAETRANGLFIFDTPRALGDFSLVDHYAEPFTQTALIGHWTLVFFGFTHCPARIAMVSVDPARDTPERLAEYVPYFHPDFLGVTGEFADILSFAQRLNAPFRKVSEPEGAYQMEHSANVMLINPRGDYHGFFRAPLDIPKMRVTLRSAQYVWEH